MPRIRCVFMPVQSQSPASKTDAAIAPDLCQTVANIHHQHRMAIANVAVCR